EHERSRGFEAPHELDDDVGSEDERLRVGGEQVARQLGVTPGVDVAHGDAHELDARADALRELLGVLEQEPGHLRADGSGAEEAHADGAVLDHAGAPSRPVGASADASSPASRASRSASVSPCTITRASPSRTATTGG